MKLEFVTIYVSDLEASIKFYTELFDLTEVNRITPNDKMKIIFFKDSEDNIIELIERTGVPFQHDNNVTIVFSTDKWQEKMSYIEKSQIAYENGPMPNYIFINDPDGFRIGLKSNQ